VRPQQHAQTDARSVTTVHNVATRDVNASHDVWRQGGVSRETERRRADSQTQDSKRGERRAAAKQSSRVACLH